MDAMCQNREEPTIGISVTRDAGATHKEGSTGGGQQSQGERETAVISHENLLWAKKIREKFGLNGRKIEKEIWAVKKKIYA